MTTKQTVDVAQILADVLGTVEGLRTAWYIADNSRPPVAVIPMPSIDYADPEAPFCFATWTFGVAIVVNRNNDRDAQRDLSRLVSEAAQAFDSATPPEGVFSIEPLSARPMTVQIAGVDQPAYELRVQVRA